MSVSNNASALKRMSKRRRGATLFQVLTTALLAAAMVASFVPSSSGRADSSTNAQRGARSAGGLFNCGYDPQGAADEWSNHKLNGLGLSKRGDGAKLDARTTAAGISMVDAGDIALAEDDGTVVISPTRFNLKNSSILFTPEGDGYRISSADVGFSRDFGTRLGYFFGVDNKLGDGDNGYRDITLQGAQFPFFGVSYDTLYVGTNGYITFTQGDTTARISPSALATELPRIAPLWADLDLTDARGIYYNRFSNRHVITWSRAAQPLYSGISTFQAVLFDDGRIAFVYGKVKVQAALVGISPGHYEADPRPVDYSNPPAQSLAGPLFETFAKQKRLDLPALLRTFYRAHSDSFDTVYVW